MAFSYYLVTINKCKNIFNRENWNDPNAATSLFHCCQSFLNKVFFLPPNPIESLHELIDVISSVAHGIYLIKNKIGWGSKEWLRLSHMTQ
jgi:hypothetical protein